MNVNLFLNISVSYSYSYNRLVETFGLLCGTSDSLVIVFQHSNVHQPSGNNILQYVLDAVGSWQITLPMPNLERAY